MRMGRRRGLISLGIPVCTALTLRTIEMLPALPIKNENQPGCEEGRGGPLNGKQEQLSRTIRNEDITSVKGKGKERTKSTGIQYFRWKRKARTQSHKHTALISESASHRRSS